MWSQEAAAGHPVRAVTRTATGAPPAPGARLVQANPAVPETMEEALDGATALFLNYSAVRDAAPPAPGAGEEAGRAPGGPAVVRGRRTRPPPTRSPSCRALEEAVESPVSTGPSCAPTCSP
ncbi:hypothetical protein LT493_02280 [Streptomyces tricolor]|nr:hypothetical protein [Streptomyces tricolor]